MEWQKIETAPRDIPILVVTRGGDIVVLEIDEDQRLGSVGFGGYEWDWDFEFEEITHWMSLPDPPK